MHFLNGKSWVNEVLSGFCVYHPHCSFLLLLRIRWQAVTLSRLIKSSSLTPSYIGHILQVLKGCIGLSVCPSYSYLTLVFIQCYLKKSFQCFYKMSPLIFEHSNMGSYVSPNFPFLPHLPLLLFFILDFWDGGSQCSLAVHELMILPPQPSWCWDYSWVWPSLDSWLTF